MIRIIQQITAKLLNKFINKPKNVDESQFEVNMDISARF
jgi:hypothetical protein